MAADSIIAIGDIATPLVKPGAKVLFIGCNGTGKSQLIRILQGDSGDDFTPFKGTKRERHQTGGKIVLEWPAYCLGIDVPVSLYDTRGLGNPTIPVSVRILDAIKSKLQTVDVLLICHKLYSPVDQMLENRVLNAVSESFGGSILSQSIILFTFGDEYVMRTKPGEPKEFLKVHMEQQQDRSLKHIKHLLCRRVDKEIVENIPSIITSGYERSLPTSENWVDELWELIGERCRLHATVFPGLTMPDWPPLQNDLYTKQKEWQKKREERGRIVVVLKHHFIREAKKRKELEEERSLQNKTKEQFEQNELTVLKTQLHKMQEKITKQQDIINGMSTVLLTSGGIHGKKSTGELPTDENEIFNSEISVNDTIGQLKKEIVDKDRQIANLMKKNSTQDQLLKKLESYIKTFEETATELETPKRSLFCDASVNVQSKIPNLFGSFSVHVAKENSFSIQGTAPDLLDWEEYGLKIGVSQGTVSSSDTVVVSVLALAGGHFEFPKNTKLVSGIYAITITKKPLKPLRLDVQHCVNLTKQGQAKYLKFAIAPVRTSCLPYYFSPLSGGQFEVGNCYGSIYRKEFSFLCIILGEDDDPDPIRNGNTGGNGVAPDEENIEEQGGPNEPDEENIEEQGGPNEPDEENIEEQGGPNEPDEENIEEQGGPNEPAPGEENIEERQGGPNEPAPGEENIEERQGGRNEVVPLSDLLWYSGLMYYEKGRRTDTMKFAVMKGLNILNSIVKEHQTRRPYIDIYFQFKPNCNHIKLIFDDSNQIKEETRGWKVKPLTIPCKLMKDSIDRFGEKDSSFPPTMSASIHYPATSNADSSSVALVLRYAVPLEGIVDPIILFIERDLEPRDLPSDSEPSESNETNIEIFREHFADLQQVMSVGANRLSMASILYSAKLIPEQSYDKAVDDSLISDQARGTSLMLALRDTIKLRPQLLFKLINEMKKVESFKEIAEKLTTKIT